MLQLGFNPNRSVRIVENDHGEWELRDYPFPYVLVGYGGENHLTIIPMGSRMT